MYVVDYLRTHRVNFETFFHSPASSASRLASCMGVCGRCVAKPVLVKAAEEFLLAVLPATSRIDFNSLGAGLDVGQGRLRLATPEEIDRIFGDCEPGAMPPLGKLYGMRSVAEAGLANAGEIILGTNLRHLGVKIQFRDYARLEEPLIAEFGRPIISGPERTSPRKQPRRAG
jgi:Ala-tRNA(Pro) deacylase